jgi:hypothetical protein
MRSHTEITIFRQPDEYDKSDGAMVVDYGENGRSVFLIDGGERSGIIRSAVLSQRTGDEPVHVTSIITHTHKDHVTELIKEVFPDKGIVVDAVYLPEKTKLFSAGTFDDAMNSDLTHRPELFGVLASCQPQAKVIVVPFGGDALTIPLACGSITLYPPVCDWGQGEELSDLLGWYYGKDEEQRKRENAPVAVVNANSLWVRVESHGSSMLFTADSMKKLEGKEEAFDRMVSRYGKALRSDVVKYPHHGVMRNEACDLVGKLRKDSGSLVVVSARSADRYSIPLLEEKGMRWVNASSDDVLLSFTDQGISLERRKGKKVSMNHRQKQLEYDVVVIGGGAGGLCAAISAGREGMRTLLVERTGVLGGCAASGLTILGYLDRQGNRCLGGLPEEINRRLKEVGGAMGHFRCPVHNSMSPISAPAFKILAVEMCEEAGVDILFNCDLTDVHMNGDRIEEVTVYGKCTDIHVKGKVFVDGTGDGDLAWMSGCSYREGQDAAKTMQPATLVFTMADFDLKEFYAWLEKHPSELGIKEDYAKGYDLNFFRNTPGHCLIGLTDTIRKARENGDFTIPRNQFIYIKTSVPSLLVNNTSRIINIDASDPFQLSKGLETGYKQVKEQILFLRKYVPGFENVVVSSISSTLGIRETRHYTGIRTLTKEEMVSYKTDNETIALCGYNVDIHSGRGDKIDLAPLEKAFGIPYGCFVAKETKNLFLSGRTLSVDPTVYAAARVMGPLMQASEGIGIASSICVRNHVDPKDVNVGEVRKRLLGKGAILSIKEEEVK